MLVCWASVGGLHSAPAVEHQEVFWSWVDHYIDRLKCQMAVQLVCFEPSSQIPRTHRDCTVNSGSKCWNTDPMSMSASHWFGRPPSFTTLSVHSFHSTPACPGTHIKWTTSSVWRISGSDGYKFSPNFAEFDSNARIQHVFLSTDNLAMLSRRKGMWYVKSSGILYKKTWNLHDSAFKYSLHDLHKSSPPCIKQL